MIAKLRGVVRHYAWGSREAIAELQGRARPTAEPEAELWLGAHPLAPATLELPDGPVPLDAWLAETAGAGGPDLCFLVKILAAARPLSIQTHPDAATAAAGFAREEAAGVPRDAAHRVFRDPRAKPELVVALTPFRALVGFRPESEILAMLDRMDNPVLDRLAEPFRGHPSAESLRALVAGAFALPAPERTALAQAIGARCREVHHPTTALGAALADAFPGDLGLLLALLLNPVRLTEGEALFLGPGVPHAYLEGTAVEVMGCSDNTLRGGLTPKHVAVDALLAVLRWEMGTVTPLLPELRDDVPTYPTPSPAFELASFEVLEPRTLAARGPEVWWVAEGALTLAEPGQEPLVLARGEAAFVDARTASVALDGPAWVFRARAG